MENLVYGLLASVCVTSFFINMMRLFIMMSTEDDDKMDRVYHAVMMILSAWCFFGAIMHLKFIG